LSVLVLKLSVLKIYSDYAHEYASAKTLINDIIAVASISHAIPIRDFEKCKKLAAKYLCCACVR
jgi:hypothetical protein